MVIVPRARDLAGFEVRRALPSARTQLVGPFIFFEEMGPSALLLGGEPTDGPRHIWWNFVSTRKDRIEQAKADWQAGRSAAVPGDPERIPLPEP